MGEKQSVKNGHLKTLMSHMSEFLASGMYSFHTQIDPLQSSIPAAFFNVGFSNNAIVTNLRFVGQQHDADQLTEKSERLQAAKHLIFNQNI